MASVFKRFPLRLRQAIVSRLGWSGLRPVQERIKNSVPYSVKTLGPKRLTRSLRSYRGLLLLP